MAAETEGPVMTVTDRELAERIAEAVWVNGFGERAGHLRLFTGTGDGGRYLGGWGYEPFLDRIEQAIREARAEVSP